MNYWHNKWRSKNREGEFKEKGEDGEKKKKRYRERISHPMAYFKQYKFDLKGVGTYNPYESSCNQGKDIVMS